jgi:predicted phosphohydrolase
MLSKQTAVAVAVLVLLVFAWASWRRVLYNNIMPTTTTLNDNVKTSGDAETPWLLRATEKNRGTGIARVVCMGDSHSRHASVKVPPGDVLLHSGDFSMFGNRAHVEAFNAWLGTLPHRHKVVVAGNHDSGTKGGPPRGGVLLPELEKLLTNAIYLSDGFVDLTLDPTETNETAGRVLRVYGSPWQPQYRGFGSFLPDAQAGSIWEHTMPKREAARGFVVLTHTPPLSVLDSESDGDENDDGIGSAALWRIVEDRRPLLHCFGHIHRPGGRTALINFERMDAGSRKDDVLHSTNADGSDGLTMAREGQTLFVNDALATNSIAQDGAYQLRSGGKPIAVGIPYKLLAKAPV